MLKRKIVATAKAISWSSASRIGPTVTIAVAPQIAVPTPMRLTNREGTRSQRPTSAVSPRARTMVATMTASEPAPTRTTSPSASVAPKRTMARRSSRLSVYSTPGVWTAGRPAVLRMATPAARASTGAPISGMRRPSIHAAVAISATAATPGRSAPARARNRSALAVAAPSLTAATRQAPQVFGGVHVLPAILERDGHTVLRVGLDHRARPRVSLQREQIQVEGGVEEHRYPHRPTVRGGDDAFTFLQVCVDQPVDDLRGDAWLVINRLIDTYLQEGMCRSA